MRTRVEGKLSRNKRSFIAPRVFLAATAPPPNLVDRSIWWHESCLLPWMLLLSGRCMPRAPRRELKGNGWLKVALESRLLQPPRAPSLRRVHHFFYSRGCCAGNTFSRGWVAAVGSRLVHPEAREVVPKTKRKKLRYM